MKPHVHWHSGALVARRWTIPLLLRSRRWRIRGRTIFASLGVGLVLTLRPQTAWTVDASDYLLLPTVHQGERELDWRSGIGSSGATALQEADSALGFGFGVTQHWFTELAVRYRRSAGSGTAFRAVEWENILQLGEPGEWPIDVGMAIDVEQTHDSQDGVEVLTGPLLQKEFGRFQANFNALVSRHFRDSELLPTTYEYQGQIKYRYSEPLEYGVQAFGTLGSKTQYWAAYHEQVHRIGLVVLGRFEFLRERSISYNAAFLLGTTAHSPDRTLRFQIEYEF